MTGRAVFLCFVLSVATVLGAACGAQPTPTGGPDITGIVWQVFAGAGGSGSLYVVGVQGGAGSYDRASVTVTADTVWHVAGGSGSRPPLGGDLVGRRVAVTFSGAVAESYPVQATAGSVRVLDPLGVSMNVTPAGLPQVHGRAVALVRDDAGTVVALRVRRGSSAATPRDVPVSADTAWLLATRTELKPTKGVPLIGNGLEPTIDVRLAGGVAVWVAVFLPR